MKKKLLFGVLTVIATLFILITCSSKVNAEVDLSKIDYVENSYDGTIRVSAANKYVETIEIPEKINGKLVTKISANGFSECKYLTTVKLPNTITEIDRNAFYGCEALKSINIPNSINSIGDSAFENCKSLQNVSIPASIQEIGAYCFKGCTSLRTAKIQGKMFIQNSAFENCTSLITVTIQDGVYGIEDSAFKNCSSLTTVSLPDSVSVIDESAFYNCVELTNITIPENVTEIYENTFTNCKKLETVRLTGVREIKKIGWIGELHGAFEGCTSLKTVYFSKAISSIESNTFKGIPASQLTIYGYAETPVKYFAQENGYKYVQCTPVSSIKITGSNSVMETNKITLRATVSPTNAFNKGISWESSNETIAKVDKNGIVTALLAGTTTITATAKDGSQTKATYKITVTPYKMPFVDVNKNDWYYNSVLFVYREKIIQGANETQFKPKDKLTRGQLATILWRMENSPKVTTSKNFPDIKKGDYYYDAVRWAASKKIVNGYSTGKFGPNNNVTREQLAIMLCNYANYKGKSVNLVTNLCNYEDANKVNSYSKDALRWAIANKIISGKTNQETNGKKIDPQGNATRAEAAAMLQNYCYYVKNSTQKDVDLMKYYAYPSKESEQNYDIYDEIEFQDNNKFIHRYKDYKNNYISENGTYKLTGTRVTLEYANNKTRYIIISNNNNIFEYDERYEIPVQKNKTYELNNSYRYLAMLTFENNNKFSLAYGVPNSGAIVMLGTYKIEGANITFTVTQEGDEGGIFPVKSFKIKGILTADGKTVYLKVDTEDWRLVLE